MATNPSRPGPGAALPPPWFYALLFLASLGPYILTLNPALFRNDSPETITACATLGICHPPGYPLHSLLGRLFSMISLGNPAFVLNLFSAFLSALGVALMGANLWVFLRPLSFQKQNKKNYLPLRLGLCLTGSLALAFSKSYWSLSLSAKGGVYILQMVLELSFIFSLQKAALLKSISRRAAYFSTFLFALGFTNHWPTQTLLLPALFVTALFFPSRKKMNFAMFLQPKIILTGLTFFLLAASLFLYLPLRASLNPALDFGDPRTSQRFMACLLRSDYAKIETLAATPNILDFIRPKAAYISNHFLDEFHFSFFILFLLGLFALIGSRLQKQLLFLVTLFSTVWVLNTVYLKVVPIEYWHMDDHLITLTAAAVPIAGAGLFWLLSQWPRSLSQYSLLRSFGICLCLLFPPFAALFKYLPVNNQTKEFTYRGYGVAILKSIGKSGVYFGESIMIFFRSSTFGKSRKKG